MAGGFGNCETRTADPRIVLAEKRSRMCFLNPGKAEVRKILIDDCVITDGLRCDYLVIGKDGVEQYVELKGSSVRHALKQVGATITRVSQQPKTFEKKAYIITTRCPIASPELQTMRKRFKKDYNAMLTMGRSGLEVNV
ncbi:MAG: hypothetical protein ACLFTT_09520 [Candidatus Hydrogenedentota bacterium]